MKKAKKFSALDMTYVALFAVLISVCAWVAVPTVPPFTLQTLGVMLSAALLGWKRGLAAVFIYILLGAIGLPVFSGFQSGLGVLLGPSGGYIWGFIFLALSVGLFAQKEKSGYLLVGMILGLLLCYACGAAWFMLVYTRSSGSIGLWAALGSCVLPFILPDLVKMLLAFYLHRRLRGFIRP